jgi:hypothetical protein
MLRLGTLQGSTMGTEVAEMMRKWAAAVTAATVIGLAGLGAATAAASPGWRQPTVSVSGAVGSPATYSLTQLGAQTPQYSFPVTSWTWRGPRTVTNSGVSVENLVNASTPTLPNVKNALLRVTVTVESQSRAVTFALGELDAGFGDHPAYLALQTNVAPGGNGQPLSAPELVVPGDTFGVRTITDVDRIVVAVQNPAQTTPPAAGDVTIEAGPFTRVLTAARLASLPQRTLRVSFLAGTAAQTHTEVGPTLQAVLRAARIPTDLNTWVAAVGSDGYVATVTPAEAWVGGRPLLISLNEDGQALAQPRLVTDGDVKGGRYVSGVVDIAVGSGLGFGSPWWGW